MNHRWIALSFGAAGTLSAARYFTASVHAKSEPRRPHFSFGVIADIQHADIENATNFSGSETRYYRDVLRHTATAVEFWNNCEPEPLFIAQLGDLIDGQNAGKYGQGLKQGWGEAPQTQTAFERVYSILRKSKAPLYHAIGNHELYNFEPSQLDEKLNVQQHDVVSKDGEFHFSFRPCKGFTFIMLNTYDISLMLPKESEGYREAARLLRANNPNDVIDSQLGGVDFFANMKGEQMRYVPFNGGVGRRQLQWLQTEVSEARRRGDRIVVLSHVPLYHKAASWKTVVFNYDEILQILHEDGGGYVVAVIAGHHHQGGYAVDKHGLHHVTLQSPLTHGESHGIVHVFDGHIELQGEGALPSRHMPFARTEPTRARL